MDVSVVVPSHAAARTLPALLDALEAQTLDPRRFEILVVDPCADGGHRVAEERARRRRGAPIRVVRSPLGGGPAVKRNLGAEVARGRLLAFTDSDCLPDPGWLEAGLRAHESGFDVVQGFVLPPDGQGPTRLGHWIYVNSDHGLYESSNIFYERGLFRSLGGFPTHWYRRYGLPFGEDAELGWRAMRAGARYRLEDQAVVRHPVGPPSLRGHLREQWLGRGFPQLVREVPELREALFYRRLFLTRESAKFTAALVGLAAARRVPAAVALALPYARSLAAEERDHPTRPHLQAAGIKLLSDAALFAGLVLGSARARSLVL